jgi:signal transduction histidine kinase
MRPKRKDVFERWTPVWHAFFYVMIAVATGLVLVRFTAMGRPRSAVVIAVVALVAWHVAMLARIRGNPRERPRQVGVYLVGAALLSLWLVHVDLTFLMVAMTLYNHVFAFLVMRWALPAAGALSVAIALVVMRAADAVTMFVLLIAAGAALMFAFFLRATGEESDARLALIEELERTREQLAFAERLAGMTEERHRIGRELHDTVTQQLIGIVMHLEAAKSIEEGRAAIETSLRLAREGLAEARRLVWADRPAQLEEGSLSRALAAMLDRVKRETSMKVEAEIDEGIDALPAAIQTLVLRATQEALANVRKHARATRVAVSVAVSDGLLAIDVQDDGVGFDGPPPARTGAGFGLHGLRERLSAHRGSLTIESAPGAGTTIAVHVPREGPA